MEKDPPNGDERQRSDDALADGTASDVDAVVRTTGG